MVAGLGSASPSGPYQRHPFLDCGVFEHGFARVSCPECRAEFLVAFPCQRRGLCPSCAAKRGALFGAFLAEEVVEDVGHCLWTFTPQPRPAGFTARNRACCSIASRRLLVSARPQAEPAGATP